MEGTIIEVDHRDVEWSRVRDYRVYVDCSRCRL